jgi:hypothetical protein
MMYKDAIRYTKCSMCGVKVDTWEEEDGGAPEGAEISEGKWVCSDDCWDESV